jgi:hypothetical protein
MHHDIKLQCLYLHAMKWSTFLLGMYILLLSFLPCADSKECTAFGEQRISALAGHEGHNHQQESCTPFCICACCGTVTFFQQVTLFPVPHTQLQERPEFHNVLSFHSYDFHTVWQPPQLMS